MRSVLETLCASTLPSFSDTVAYGPMNNTKCFARKLCSMVLMLSISRCLSVDKNHQIEATAQADRTFFGKCITYVLWLILTQQGICLGGGCRGTTNSPQTALPHSIPGIHLSHMETSVCLLQQVWDVLTNKDVCVCSHQLKLISKAELGKVCLVSLHSWHAFHHGVQLLFIGNLPGQLPLLAIGFAADERHSDG